MESYNTAITKLSEQNQILNAKIKDILQLETRINNKIESQRKILTEALDSNFLRIQKLEKTQMELIRDRTSTSTPTPSPRRELDPVEDQLLVFKQIKNKNCYLWSVLLLMFNTSMQKFMPRDVQDELQDDQRRKDLVLRTEKLHKNFETIVRSKLGGLGAAAVKHFTFNEQYGGSPIYVLPLWLEHMKLSWSLEPGYNVWMGLQQWFMIHPELFGKYFQNGYLSPKPIVIERYLTRNKEYIHIGGIIISQWDGDGHATCFVYDKFGKRKLVETSDGKISDEITSNLQFMVNAKKGKFSFINIFVEKNIL